MFSAANSSSRTAVIGNLRSSGSARRGRKRGSFCYSRPLRRPDVGGAPFTTQFLIANPRLELIANGSKHSNLQISNRERIAVFLSLRVRSLPQPAAQSSRQGPAWWTVRRLISNSNIRQFRNSTKPLGISTYAFSNSNKNGLFGKFA